MHHPCAFISLCSHPGTGDQSHQRKRKDPQGVLQYNAPGDDASPEKVAMRYTYTVLGAPHTVVGAIVDMLHEVCAQLRVC